MVTEHHATHQNSLDQLAPPPPGDNQIQIPPPSPATRATVISPSNFWGREPQTHKSQSTVHCRGIWGCQIVRGTVQTFRLVFWGLTSCSKQRQERQCTVEFRTPQKTKLHPTLPLKGSQLSGYRKLLGDLYGRSGSSQLKHK
uniref:Uncharacterized protein n=1 Tax=Eutreptiella gymnastica TaxID=73025 RepID=A0A7S1IB77_9EUGL